MKTLKTVGAALVLALSLSIPAYADTNPGDGHSPGLPDPAATDVEGSTTPKVPATDDPGAVILDLGVQTLADILWSLASIY
jgi:hypothetical protein